ncbi:hypothetical protein FJZ41_02450 [Candidatus Shapirobacteria bacterium]|nr:hypothetical protein [Candidatus Shapirobacteria bacterium]
MEEKPNFLEKFWYLFVILAVVLLGVVGGLWYNNQKSAQLGTTGQGAPTVEEQIAPTGETDTQTAQLENQSDSDEVSEIENDLGNTDFSGIDQEINDIEGEISPL